MDMPKPGPHHAALQAFNGTWQGTERMPPSQWLPEESTADGRIVNRPALGGFAVIQDYAQSSGGVTRYEGHGIFTWDAEADEYCLHWFDSIGGSLEQFRGTMKDNVWTLISKGPRGQMRNIWAFDAPGHYRHEMATSPDGKQWALMMAGEYRKVET